MSEKGATFVVDKECKHSRRYQSQNEKFPIDSIYVRREYADGKDKILVVLTTFLTPTES